MLRTKEDSSLQKASKSFSSLAFIGLQEMVVCNVARDGRCAAVAVKSSYHHPWLYFLDAVQ